MNDESFIDERIDSAILSAERYVDVKWSKLQ